MSTTKRIYALLLAILMMAAGFTGCSESNTESDSPAAPVMENESITSETDAEETSAPQAEETAENPYISDSLADESFGGANFRILSGSNGVLETANFIIYDEITGTPINDVLYESKTSVEERFDVSITWSSAGSYNDVPNSARTSITAGDNSFELLIGQDHDTVALTTEGLCLNLLSVDEFDFDKPWWPKMTVDSMRIGDKLYAASSYLSYAGIYWTRVYVINKDYAAEIQLEIPYNDVREGKWTVDRLIAITDSASIDKNGDGVIGDGDRYALTSGSQTWYCMQEACGIPIYSHDENNIPYLNADIDRITTYVDKMRVLMGSDRYKHESYYGTDTFSNNNALFIFSTISNVYNSFRDGDITYGYLPTPKLDELQENYINACTDAPWAMPNTVVGDQQHMAAAVIEALSCVNYNNALPVFFEGALKARSADTPDDTEMLQLIADTRVIGFAYAYDLAFSNIVNDCVLGNSEVASYIRSSKKVAEKNLEKLVKAFSEY